MKLSTLFTTALAAAATTRAATLTQVPDFGDNPSGALMYIYVPDSLDTTSAPAIIVAIHWCTGTANAYYTGTQYASLAETYGSFIVVYPESPYEGGCWDVSSEASLTRDGGGNSNAIANMVRWTLDEYGADEARVFVTGTSSGAMMTNVLAGTYPDLFAAGVVYAGVPATCFYTGTVNGWNSTCSGGSVVESQEYWAGAVQGMYPNYTGAYPKMRIFHGSQDTTLAAQNYNETIKQWTGVFGYSDTPTEVYGSDPASPYTREVYGEGVEGVYGAGITHDIDRFEDTDLEWFGIV